MDNAERGAFLASTARTTRTVGVVLYVVRQSIIDDVCEVVNVESASSNVRCHQQLYSVLTELLHSEVALLLRQVTVQRFCIVTVANQFVSHFLRLNLRATEDDGEDARIEIYQTFQCQILVLRIYHIIDVVDVFGTFVA